MKFGLAPPIVQSIQEIFARYPAIEQVQLFGSRASGSYRDSSDIDLAIFAPTLTDREFALLWNAVDDLPLAFKVDLLHYDRLSNAALRQKILVEGVKFEVDD